MVRILLDHCCVCNGRKSDEYGKDNWKNPELWLVDRESMKVIAQVVVCPSCAKIVTVQSIIQQIKNAEDF